MRKKIRIAYLIDTIDSDKAGTEKQLLNIIDRLDRDKYEILLVCLYDSPWMLLNRLPCEVISLGYRGFVKTNILIVLWQYLSTLRQRQCDVVQTFFEDAIFIGYLGKIFSRNKHSLVISRRDMGLGNDVPEYHNLYKKVMPLIFKSVDGIATNSQVIRDHISEQNKISQVEIRVIGNGLDLPVPLREPPPLFRENFADIWVGIVANLKSVKRIDLLLHALVCLKSTGNNKIVRAVILGDGRLRSELIQLATDLGISDKVHFMGAVGNVNDYLQCIDIGVLCSDMEGLPNAVLEYMACGLPVIVTAVGGNCELVDETNGICFPSGDYHALGSALSRLVASAPLRKLMGKKSLEKVQNNYIWEKIMPQWESFYCSLVR